MPSCLDDMDADETLRGLLDRSCEVNRRPVLEKAVGCLVDSAGGV